MMVKQLIYDSRMIVKKGTIISVCYDIQSSHKKHDGMIVVFQIFLLLAYFTGAKWSTRIGCIPLLNISFLMYMQRIRVRSRERQCGHLIFLRNPRLP